MSDHHLDGLDSEIAEAFYAVSALQMALDHVIGEPLGESDAKSIVVYSEQANTLFHLAGQAAMHLRAADRMRNDMETAPH